MRDRKFVLGTILAKYRSCNHEESLLDIFHYGMGIGEMSHQGIPQHVSPETQVNKARAILAKYGDKLEQRKYRPKYMRRKADKEFLEKESKQSLMQGTTTTCVSSLASL